MRTSGPNRLATSTLAPRQVVTYRLLVPDATRSLAGQIAEPYV